MRRHAGIGCRAAGCGWADSGDARLLARVGCSTTGPVTAAGTDPKTADDVDSAGFWGRRFDIYRSVVSVDGDTRRGKRRWVRPVIGADVPRNQEQRAFMDGLRSDPSDTLLRVEDTITTVPELMAWATIDGDSDLVFLFCHTRSARYEKWEASPATNWLGFGQTEDEARVGLDELERWRGSRA
jgi:hypothetical protein